MLRPTTADSYAERIGRVLAHIRENLDSPLTIGRLAEVACLSPFHFHRIFSAHMAETVADHVRRLRLERAATQIALSGGSITDAALEVGYETPAAFGRAFRERFGMSPSEFREQWAGQLPSFAETIPVQEVVAMKPEMREFPETRVLFVRKPGAYSEAASAAWGVLMGFAYGRRLMSSTTLMIGIGNADPSITPAEDLRYDACITFSGDVQPEGEVAIQAIAGGRYAVFLHKGAYTGLNDTYRSIFAGWLPASGYALAERPCFEVYLNRDPRRTKPENLRTEIWVPVV